MKFRIWFSKYFIWFLVNFVFCLLPIFISGLIVNGYTDDIFLSYIAFTYTLIICSLYAFDSREGRDSALLWSGIIISTITLVFFILFPKLLPPSVCSFIRQNIWLITIGILATNILLSLFLNNGSIKDLIERDLAKREFRQAKKTGNRVDGMANQLKGEQ